MSPTIHAVRHAQGLHNLSEANHSLRDPALTDLGKQQCRTLQSEFPYHDQIDLIVASPLKRTIYTALLAFEDIIAKKKLSVIALPELQETSDLPCDTGSSPEELAREFKDMPCVDLSLVHPGWNSKKMQWAPTPKAIEARARKARQWLMDRPEKNIALVAHGSILHHFTEDWEGCDRFPGTGWANTEFRSYTFSDQDTESAHLIETYESRKRRQPKPLDREERTNLERTTAVNDGKQAREQAVSAKRLFDKMNGNQRDGITNSL